MEFASEGVRKVAYKTVFHRARVSENMLRWYQRQHDQVPNFFPCCATQCCVFPCSCCWSFSSLNIFEDWRPETLRRACCCLNFFRCVGKIRSTVITRSGFDPWIRSESRKREFESSLVCSARNSTLGCRHIKWLRTWLCEHSHHLRDGLTALLVS